MAALQRHTMNSSASSGSASSVTQLEFHQAMTDFKIMFPSMDEDVIECVLRSNSGAVDATIDQLLQMASDLEKGLGQPHPVPATAAITSNGSATISPATAPKPMNEQRNQLISLEDEDTTAALSQTPPPAYHQAVPCEAISNATSRVKNCNLESTATVTPAVLPTSGFSAAVASNILSQKVSNNSLRARFKWNPPLIGPLPDTFLRFPDPSIHRYYQPHQVQRQGSREIIRQRSHSDRLNNTRPNVLSTSLLQQKMQENELKRQSASVAETAQFLDDERLAILMQNEEFVRELRNNKEFMSQLQRDAGRSAAGDERDGATASGGSSGASNFSDAAFREMLKNMSKMSRKKFAQVAGMFSRRKRNKSEGSGGLSSPNRHVSKDHLLASGKDDEYRELENDSSDSEDRHSPYWERTRDKDDPVFVGIRSPDRSRRDGNNSGFRL